MSECLQIVGPLTFDSAAGQLGALGVLARGSRLLLDLSGVTEVDSSAVALLLHWFRQACSAGAELQFVSPPPGLRQLASVYGVNELLPLGE